MTLDFLFFGTGLYVRRELSDIIVLRSIVLVQHLNLELGVTRDVLDPPEFVPYGLQCVGLNGRTVEYKVSNVDERNAQGSSITCTNRDGATLHITTANDTQQHHRGQPERTTTRRK